MSLVAILPSNLRQPKKAAYTYCRRRRRDDGRPILSGVLRDSIEKDLLGRATIQRDIDCGGAAVGLIENR